MAKRPSLPTITGAFSSATQLNAAFRAIETAMDNTLSLDGSTPNSMDADLDLDGNDILNAGVVNATDYKLDGEDLGLDEAVTNANNYAASAAASAAAAAEYDLLPKGINFWDYLSSYSQVDKDAIANGTYAGDLATPWAAFHAALLAEETAGRKPYGVIPQCEIRTSVSPNFAMDDLTLETQGNVRIIGISGAKGLSFNGVAKGVGGYGVRRLNIGKLTTGSVSGTNGAEIIMVQQSDFAGIQSLGGSLYGILVDSCVSDNFVGFVCQNQSEAFLQSPTIGLYVTGGSHALSGATSWCKFDTPITEYMALGMRFDVTFGNSIISGTAEGCTNTGITLGADAEFNKFYGIDFEANTTRDVYCLGDRNEFYGTDTQTEFLIDGTAFGNRIFGGKHSLIQCAVGTANNLVQGANVTTVTDASTGLQANRFLNIVGPTGTWRNVWKTYTPTASSLAGTITTATASGEYLLEDGLVHFRAVVAITNNGTGSNAVRVSLPFTAQADTVFYGVETESTGRGLAVTTSVDKTLALMRFSSDGTYPGAASRTMVISGSYRPAV